MVTERIEKREKLFWDKVNKSGECWEWTASLNRQGYGSFSAPEFKQKLAHRYSWIIANGLIPGGMQVCHHCDNPKCVRPDHLFLGTHQDNMRDMTVKGRAPRTNAHKDTCPRGHAYTPDNTYICKRGKRYCRACNRLKQWKKFGFPAFVAHNTQTSDMAEATTRWRFGQKLTHCKRGHEYTPENTIIWKHMRRCRACAQMRDRARGWRRKPKLTTPLQESK